MTDRSLLAIKGLSTDHAGGAAFFHTSAVQDLFSEAAAEEAGPEEIFIPRGRPLLKIAGLFCRLYFRNLTPLDLLPCIDGLPSQEKFFRKYLLTIFSLYIFTV